MGIINNARGVEILVRRCLVFKVCGDGPLREGGKFRGEGFVKILVNGGITSVLTPTMGNPDQSINLHCKLVDLFLYECNST